MTVAGQQLHANPAQPALNALGPRIAWRLGLAYGALWGITVATLESLGSPAVSARDAAAVVLMLMWMTRGTVLAWTALALERPRHSWGLIVPVLLLEVVVLGLAWDGLAAAGSLTNRLLGAALPVHANLVYNIGVLLIYGGPLVWFCMVGRRAARSRDVLGRAEIERTRTAAMLNDAQLAAMKGRIDPDLLLRAMARVRALYAAERARAEALLDALVAFLRLAMPGVRGTHSSVDAELALLAAYARLTQGLDTHGMRCTIEADALPCGQPFPAMLLLPLVDRLYAAQVSAKAPVLVALTAEPGCMKLTLNVTAARADWLGDALEQRLEQSAQGPCGNGARWTSGGSPSLTLWLPLLPDIEEDLNEQP
jgi:hypothetical protein